MAQTTTAPSPLAGDDLVARFDAVRGFTEELAAPLSAEDQTAQSMPDVSPTKWHRAHTTWFFETFVLERFEPGFAPVDPAYRVLFNSYYETVGEQYPRPDRGVITRPGVAEVTAYRAVVDDRVRTLLDASDEPAALVALGLEHEQQHQELLLMDIKHVLAQNPTHPAYREQRIPSTGGAPRPTGWVDVHGGLVEIGHPGPAGDVGDTDSFAYDNEQPRHRVHLEPYRLADRLVTAGEWIEFIDDGGYARPDLWLSDGWGAVCSAGWEAPLYWWRDAGSPSGWSIQTLGGARPVEVDEPVCHVSYYEADAFARWAGARLPTEHEWEHAVACAPTTADRALELDALHPWPATDHLAGTIAQVGGECWQWTASAYLPYPGFAPAPGAVGEYNGKFMSGQMVLRGGSALTPTGHSRPTYRNFFPPAARWPMTGVRLATDGRVRP